MTPSDTSRMRTKRTKRTNYEQRYKPRCIEENRGWTDLEAKEFIAEVERLKALWYPEESSKPDITTGEVLANHKVAYDRTNGFAAIRQENEERRIENERRTKRRLRMIELLNRNLEWPKPVPLKKRKSSDYWENGCPSCGCDFKPKDTDDYERLVVFSHPGKPAYPGPADIEEYGLPPPNGPTATCCTSCSNQGFI
jgi:hypothetical protein